MGVEGRGRENVTSYAFFSAITRASFRCVITVNNVKFITKLNSSYSSELKPSVLPKKAKYAVHLTITILGIIHRPVFYLKQPFGERILSPPLGRTYSFEPNRKN
jgi:hypothetical protein